MTGFTYTGLLKTAGKWDKTFMRDITPQVWNNLRKLFPSLPKDPSKSLTYKTSLPIRSSWTNLDTAFKDTPEKFRLLQNTANGWTTVKGAIRPKFGVGSYKVIPDIGFEYKDKTGKISRIVLDDIPAYRNVKKIQTNSGVPMYAAIASNDVIDTVDPMKAQTIISGDPEWWKRRVFWRFNPKNGVSAHYTQGYAPEELIRNGQVRQAVNVVNRPVNAFGEDIYPNNTGSMHWQDDSGHDLVAFKKSFDQDAVNMHDVMANSPKDSDGLVQFPYGMQSNPVTSGVTSHKGYGFSTVPAVTYDELESMATRSGFNPGTMQHELTHATQSGDPHIWDQTVAKNDTARHLGIDYYSYKPSEVLQSGMSYKASIRAAQMLPDDELVRIFGDQAPRVKALRPFAIGDRAVYRDLEYLRQHPDVAMKLGKETSRVVARYAHLKQLSWDIKRRMGLHTKLTGATASDLAKAKEHMLTDYYMGPMHATTDDQRSALLRLLDHRERELNQVSHDLQRQSDVIDEYRKWFLNLHKRASKR